MDDTSDQTSVL